MDHGPFRPRACTPSIQTWSLYPIHSDLETAPYPFRLGALCTLNAYFKPHGSLVIAEPVRITDPPKGPLSVDWLSHCTGRAGLIDKNIKRLNTPTSACQRLSKKSGLLFHAVAREDSMRWNGDDQPSSSSRFQIWIYCDAVSRSTNKVNPVNYYYETAAEVGGGVFFREKRAKSVKHYSTRVSHHTQHLNEPQWTSMNLHEPQWTPMNLNEPQWTSNERQWTSMNLNEPQWTSMNLNEPQWTSMNVMNSN